MNVLALDTASPSPALALFWSDRLFEQPLEPDRRASETLLPGLSRLLDIAKGHWEGCSRIAVCSGPGSFTGVRVGLATAWGLSRALGIAIESVPSLEALAEAARPSGLESATAVLEAGRGEVIVERFDLTGDRARSLGEARRLSIEDAATRVREEETVSLPVSLLGFRGRDLSISLAGAAALAVARAPRETTGTPPVAIYARRSAAEEKFGAP